MKTPFLIILSLCASLQSCQQSKQNQDMQTVEQNNEQIQMNFTKLDAKVSELVAGFEQIKPERKEQLAQMAQYIQAQREAQSPILLTFICTHNSRRSHISQIWAQKAAAYYGVEQVSCFSGGTETTAFNSRAVKAMQEIGFHIETKDQTEENPHYMVYFDAKQAPLEAFSKNFADLFNPQSNFCAVMTCSSADEACPFVAGSAKRVAIPYIDPKISDGTAEEAQTYKERCEQIGTEMLYVFSLVKKTA